MPSPSDVSSGDLYDRFGPAESVLGDYVTQIKDAVMNPEAASGWIGIIIPAVVTALAIQAVKRVL